MKGSAEYVMARNNQRQNTWPVSSNSHAENMSTSSLQENYGCKYCHEFKDANNTLSRVEMHDHLWKFLKKAENGAGARSAWNLQYLRWMPLNQNLCGGPHAEEKTDSA